MGIKYQYSLWYSAELDGMASLAALAVSTCALMGDWLLVSSNAWVRHPSNAGVRHLVSATHGSSRCMQLGA